MINFIKQNNRVENLYINKDIFNKIIDDFKELIIDNKETLIKIYNIDKGKTSLDFNLQTIINLLDLYKNQEIKNEDKKIIIAKYCGSPYITTNLCMQSLIKKQGTIALINNTMYGINKALIGLFNSALENNKIINMIKLENNKSLEEIKNIQDEVDKIICIGDSFTYFKYYKNEVKKLVYIPYKNIALYCSSQELEELKYEMYKFAIKNGIEIEMYDDIDEFIACVNVSEELENVMLFSKDDMEINKCKDSIKKYKLYINENPFKNENYKIDI